jgi:hypothetical protein
MKHCAYLLTAEGCLHIVRRRHGVYAKKTVCGLATAEMRREPLQAMRRACGTCQEYAPRDKPDGHYKYGTRDQETTEPGATAIPRPTDPAETATLASDSDQNSGHIAALSLGSLGGWVLAPADGNRPDHGPGAGSTEEAAREKEGES